MRRLAVGVAVVIGVIVYKPWRYTWAFGQDIGAARSADWKNKPCSKALAASLYDGNVDSAIPTKRGNQFLIPGAPGHSYFAYGFRSQKACEDARTEMGSAQWDQTKPSTKTSRRSSVQSCRPSAPGTSNGLKRSGPPSPHGATGSSSGTQNSPRPNDACCRPAVS